MNYWGLKQTVSCRSGSLQCSTKGWRETAKTLHSATPLCSFKTSGTCLSPTDPEFVQIEITALVHYFRRKANEVTVGTPAFPLGFFLNMFCQWKKPHCFHIFHSSAAVQQDRHKLFSPMPPEAEKKAVLNWRNTRRKEDNKIPKTFHNTVQIVLLSSKYGTLVISLINS